MAQATKLLEQRTESREQRTEYKKGDVHGSSNKVA